MSFSPLFKSTIPSPEYFEVYGNNKSSKTNNDKNINNNIEEKNNSDIKETTENKTNKSKNMLVGSLIALATIGTPTAFYIDDNNNYENLDNTEIVESMPEEQEIFCNPKALARGGEDDSVVELNELMNLLNFASADGLPESEIEALKTIAMANLTPIAANDTDAKEKITEQIQRVQDWIDNSANEYKINPPKSEYEKKIEYNMKYVTDNEILSNVDVSELSKYQKDKTVLAALISGSRERIERSDADVIEKIEKQVRDAQTLVDNITEKYKRNAKIAGNTDFDNTLSKKELVNMLDLRSLDGLSAQERTKILKSAIKGYKPVMFDVKNNADIKTTNKQLTQIVQNTQDKIDTQADALKRKAVGL